jgi:NitT/TauT family transport system substrate-binding protein
MVSCGDSDGEATSFTYAYGGGFIASGEVGMYLPITTGCWEDAGLDVEVIPAGGSRNALQLLISGDAPVVTFAPDGVAQAHLEGEDLVSVYSRISPPNSALAIPAGSDIASLQELEGATIGVGSLSAGQAFYTIGLLGDAGLEEGDYELLPTGFNPAEAVQALESDAVDAITYWSGFYGILENEGYEFTYYQWEGLDDAPGFVIATSQEYLDENEDVITAMGRCEAMATVYAKANPEAAVRAYWEVYPENKPADIPEEEALQREIHVMQKNLDYNNETAEGWGFQSPGGWDSYVAFLANAEIISEPIPAGELYTNDLIEDMNDFDAEEVRDSASEAG